MRLLIGVTPHSAPRGEGFELPQAHILTPASEHETHYFWSSTRYHDLDSPETDALLREMFGNAFDLEDKPMIEAAYANVRARTSGPKSRSRSASTRAARAPGECSNQ
jgi:vanillate O-demethylase monooxygenase subunit